MAAKPKEPPTKDTPEKATPPAEEPKAKPSLLPTKTTPAVSDLSNLIIFLYGGIKIGKSTWASKFPDALFLATEPGLGSLDVYEIPVRDWDHMKALCNELYRGDHKFKTLVIDTADNLYKMCEKHVCESQGIVHESDLEWGKGWSLVNNEFRRVLTTLAQMPEGLILTSHATQQQIDAATEKYKKNIPTLSKGARDVILGIADFVLYARAEVNADGETVRVLKTKPNKFYEAGDRTGRLPETLPLDYDEFMAAWNKANKGKATK